MATTYNFKGIQTPQKLPKRGRGYAFVSQTRKIMKSQYLLRRMSDRHQILTGKSNHTVYFVRGPE